MELDRYDLTANADQTHYTFVSDGPKGRIAKRIVFTRLLGSPIPLYNLAFGDFDSISRRLDDRSITNNDDKEKVLATVAFSVLDFCRGRKNCLVYAEGSTPARTRLYQMGICRIWDSIKDDFNVYGSNSGTWSLFIPNSINYEALLLTRK